MSDTEATPEDSCLLVLVTKLFCDSITFLSRAIVKFFFISDRVFSRWNGVGLWEPCPRHNQVPQTGMRTLLFPRLGKSKSSVGVTFALVVAPNILTASSGFCYLCWIQSADLRACPRRTCSSLMKRK